MRKVFLRTAANESYAMRFANEKNETFLSACEFFAALANVAKDRSKDASYEVLWSGENGSEPVEYRVFGNFVDRCVEENSKPSADSDGYATAETVAYALAKNGKTKFTISWNAKQG